MKTAHFTTTLALLTATITMALSPAGAQPRPSSSKHFDIGVTNLSNALSEFARQSDRQIFFESEIVNDKQTSGFKGDSPPEAALEVLLKGSGLTYRITSDATILIESTPQNEVATERKTENSAVRIAQSSQDSKTPADPSATVATENQTTPSDPTKELKDLMTEVVVTGTHIRGAAAIGSPLIVIDREEIEKSGHGRLQDFLETLPQNFSGSTSEETSPYIDTGAANLTRGQGVDLRGLGASGTLVLVNGRRQPAGGLEGSFVDISSIPMSAVNRIEVLSDGASALYGSDAVGGVVNFILRKDYEGFETHVRMASTDEVADEVQASFVGGQSWGGGNLMLGYQYSGRDALMAAGRPYSRLNGDYRSLGGTDFRPTLYTRANPGTIRRSGQTPYAIPAGQDGTQLNVSQLIPGQVNYRDTVTGIAILPEQKLHSTFLSLTQRLNDSIDLFVGGRYSRREMKLVGLGESASLTVPSTNPFYVNPYGGTASITVDYDFTAMVGPRTQLGEAETYAFDIGTQAKLGKDWELNVAATYGRDSNVWQQINYIDSGRRNACLSGIATPAQCPGAPLNVFGDGSNNDPTTVNFIRFNDLDQGETATKSLTAIADGSLFDLSAGAVKLAVGADYRDERLDTSGYRLAPATGIVTPSNPGVGDIDRQVSAVFTELVVPVVGREGYPGDAPKLDLSFAGRYEEYSDFGSTFNPKIGLSFQPTQGVTFRASWGTSFRAPRFNEISPGSNPSLSYAYQVSDPRSPTSTSLVLFTYGADPDLKPETADIWTAGIDLRPVVWPGVSLSATYFQLDYKDKIQIGGASIDTLVYENLWAAIITRDPTPAQVAAVCSLPDFTDIGFGGCPFTQPPAAILDVRLRNLATLDVRGIDFDIGYRTDSVLGELSFRLAGVYTLTYDRAVTATSAPVSIVDTVGNPIDLKLRATAGWSSARHWSANIALNYLGAYDDPVLHRTVDSWATLDAGLSYRLERGGWMDGTSVQLSAINLFDKTPPFVDISAGYDPANASQVGRVISVSATKRW